MSDVGNLGRSDEEQLGLTLGDGEVHILAQLVHDAVGADWRSARLRCWLTDNPVPVGASVPVAATTFEGQLHALYREHRRSAHGYEATEDYEPEEYLYTTEELSIGPVDLIRVLKGRVGDCFHLVIEER